MIRFVRSNQFRVAIAFAATLTVTTYVVFALVYWRFYNANVLLVQSVLQNEIKQTSDVPFDRLRRQLELRLTQDLRHLDYVGLYDRGGTLVFGNVANGLKIRADGKAHFLRVAPPQHEDWQSENAVFVAASRTDNGTLILGRSLVYVDQLEVAMLNSFAAAILPIILGTLIVGAVVSQRASLRLIKIQQAIKAVMDGDLHMRLPARRKSDDIDELVRAVNLMLDEIVRLLNQIKSVGDNIAHDLRTPLSVMRAKLERGLVDGRAPVLRSVITEALGDLGKAMNTVTALLRISELESGLRRSGFGEIDLSAVSRDAFDLYSALGKAKGLAMGLNVNGPVIVMGDGDLLREALANLIDNAVKFTPQGGSVRVSCGGKSALVTVADTGPGIATEERGEVIKRFYRSRGAQFVPGFGLGLSMTTTILEMHGLGLRIGDEPCGAIFEIVDKDQVLGQQLTAQKPAIPSGLARPQCSLKENFNIRPPPIDIWSPRIHPPDRWNECLPAASPGSTSKDASYCPNRTVTPLHIRRYGNVDFDFRGLVLVQNADRHFS